VNTLMTMSYALPRILYLLKHLLLLYLITSKQSCNNLISTLIISLYILYVCLCILASSRIPRSILRWQTPHFLGGSFTADNISRPLTIYCDNKLTVFFLSNNKSSDATKHIDIKYFVVKDRIQDQTVEIEHISIKQMLTNPLTKDLILNIFCDHVADMVLLKSI
jgi:hypothetical protein